MSWFSTLLLLATGVCLPTFDNLSDIWLSIQLLRGTYKKYGCGQVATHPKYGIAMMVPVVFSWLFIAKQWFNTEQGTMQKLRTLPLLILQVYPQWRALRVLFYGKWRVTNGWQIMKDAYEAEISFLGTKIHLESQFLS